MTRKISELVSSFRDDKHSTAAIAEKTGESQASVKKRLIRHLGKKQYIEIARSIGGRTTAHRLRTNPRFLKRYAKQMRELVVRSLKRHMEDPAFRTAWKTKAKRGSEKGIKRLRQLMQGTAFEESWRDKCRRGGLAAYGQSSGIYAKSNAAARLQWSINGLRHTGRKVVGPRGERMYNGLEKQVAGILNALGIPYEYEKRFETDTLNGFFSVDFQAGNVFIEATYWDDPKEKSRKLNRKFRTLRELIAPNATLIVVTKPHKVEQYRTYLEKDIRVLGPKELQAFLAQ